MEFRATTAARMSLVLSPRASSTGRSRSGSSTVWSVQRHRKHRNMRDVPCRMWSSVSTTNYFLKVKVASLSSGRFDTILKFLGCNMVSTVWSTPAIFKHSRGCLHLMLSFEKVSAQIFTKWCSPKVALNISLVFSSLVWSNVSLAASSLVCIFLYLYLFLLSDKPCS